MGFINKVKPMKNIKYALGSFFLLAILIPQITFASWWNPFTWSWFTKKVTTTQTVQVNTTTRNTSNEFITNNRTQTNKDIEELKKEITDLKTKQQKETIVNKSVSTISASQEVTDCNIVLMFPNDLTVKNFIAKYGQDENVKCLTKDFTIQEKKDCDDLIVLQVDYRIKMKQLDLYNKQQECLKTNFSPDLCITTRLDAEKKVLEKIPVQTTLNSFKKKYGDPASTKCSILAKPEIIAN